MHWVAKKREIRKDQKARGVRATSDRQRKVARRKIKRGRVKRV